MTTKERLHHLVDEFDDDRAAALLNLALSLDEVPQQRRPLPAFVGAGASGKSDVSTRSHQILRDELGERGRAE